MRASWGQQSRGAWAVAIAVVALLVFAPAAQAQFGISPAATPSSTDAGANADLQIDIAVQEPAADIRDLTIHLPPGLVGNPQATPTCTSAELGADNCDPATRVGTTSTTATLLGIFPLPVSGDVYNLEPRPGEPARFGIILRPLSVGPLPPVVPPIILESGATLRPADLGLDTVLTDLPNTASGLPIDITNISLTLAGQAGNPPQGFIRLPTSCGTHTVGFDARAYDDQTASGQATFDTANCTALPFTPELSAQVEQGEIGKAVRVSTTISQTIEEAGLKRAQVTLPRDLFGNAAALGSFCSDAGFQAGSCPESAVVGTAVSTSPLLAEPLAGPVVLVGAPGALPQIGVDLRGPLSLKLKGSIEISSPNKVTFDGLPDIPIASFTLTFAEGPNGLTLANRNLCEPPPLVFEAAFDAHSGATASAQPTASVKCSGAGGGEAGGKKPRAKIKVARESSRRPTMSVRVRAGAQELRKAKVKLPRELRARQGKRFARNVDPGREVKVTATPNRITLRGRRPAGKLTAKLRPGALRAGKGLGRNSKLRFRVIIRDNAGETTRLKVTGK